MKKTTWLYTLAAAALVALLTWALLPRALPVEVVRITSGHFEQTINEDGQLRVRERYLVSAPLAGALQRITLKAGDAVSTDTVLAVIQPSAPALLDTRTRQELTERLGVAEATKQRAMAEIERAEAARVKAQNDYDRAIALSEKGVVSISQREQVELALEVAAHELEAARFAEHAAVHDVELARAALAQNQSATPAAKKTNPLTWKLYSPISGQVLRVMQESETNVTLGTALLEVGDVSRLEAVVDVLSSDAVQITPGAAVTLSRWGKPEPLQGRVRRVEPSAFTKVSALGVEEQRVNVTIDLSSPPEQWRALGDGYKIDARIVVASLDNAVIVPTSALFRDGDQWAVFVVGKNNRANKRLVHISLRSGLTAAVEKGLQAGDTVIVHPGESVEDNVRVKIR